MEICRADTNGQLGERKANGEINAKIVGPHRKANKQKGGGPEWTQQEYVHRNTRYQ